MGTIDELISQMCGKEVRWIPVGDVASFTYGYTDKADKEDGYRYIRITDILSDGHLSDDEVRYISKNSDSEKYLLNKGDIVMARTGASFGKTLYFDSDFPSVYASFLIKISFNDSVNSRYYWHFSKSQLYWNQANKLVGGGAQPQFNSNAIAQVKFPLPPLPIQEAIADILDKFDRLSAELQAELQARKQQYEYYRNQLLTRFAPDQPVTEYSLEQISSYRRGSFPQPYTNREYYGGEGSMPFVQVADVDEDGYRLNSDTKQRISLIAQKMSVFVPKGTVICTLQGTIGKVAITQYDSYVDRTLAIFTKLNKAILPRYFAFQIKRIFDLEKENARGTTIKTITKEEFSKFLIPVPSLSEQARIVSILDKFEALVNDLSQGLPAEIAAVKEQYEYYRNKLLTFDKKS